MVTGSAVQGLVGGLVKGLSAQQETASVEATDRVIFVKGDPNGVVTSSVGSQLMYDTEAPDIYIADTAGGTVWNRLGSLT